jgi:hypothetical protein
VLPLVPPPKVGCRVIRIRDNEGLTFRACRIARIPVAIGTVFSGLADQPAENPAWRSVFVLKLSTIRYGYWKQEGGVYGGTGWTEGRPEIGWWI